MYNYDFLFRYIIHPYSFLFVSDYYYGPSMTYKALKHIPHFTQHTIKKYKPYDIIFVDSELFENFIENIIDYLPYPIILITAREVLPQVEFSTQSDYVLNHKNIALWFAQNPVYDNSDKYFAIPYGINPRSLSTYFNSLIYNIFTNKDIKVSNLPTTAHKYLTDNHVRKMYPILTQSSNMIPLPLFYDAVSRSQFVISPPGDRQDCYRHYECIGLGSIPISNISIHYKNIFYDSIYLTDTKNLVAIAGYNNIDQLDYKSPNRDMICSEYYFDQFRKIIKKYDE